MTPSRRWYQLSMLQMLLAMAVVAFFIGMNTKVKVYSSYALTAREAGWPFTYVIEYGRRGTEWFNGFNRSPKNDSAKLLTIDFPRTYRVWAGVANACLCVFALFACVYGASRSARFIKRLQFSSDLSICQTHDRT